MRAASLLLLLVGCAGGDDLERALTGTRPNAEPPLELTDATVLDLDVPPPLDARMTDAAPPPDAAPTVDARPPLDAAPPPDATPTCEDEGRPCVVGQGLCRREGQIICRGDRLLCTTTPGEPASEQCDGQDNDCDGLVDEGVANACGACGLPPDEVCNGADDDCNGVVDEGLRNVCGGCGPVPAEVCDGVDQDCDGQVDEGSCRALMLRPDDNVWVAPPGLNQALQGDLVVDAAATFFSDSAEVWAFVGDRILIYRPNEDRWIDNIPLSTLAGQHTPVDTALVVPLWWRQLNQPEATRESLLLTRGNRFITFDVDPVTRQGAITSEGSVREMWGGDPLAPDPDMLRAAVLDLRNAREFWQGRPRDFCPEGGRELGPTVAILADDRLHLQDVGVCNEFVGGLQAENWPGFQLANPPDAARITAWTHIEPIDPGNGVEVIFLR